MRPRARGLDVAARIAVCVVAGLSAECSSSDASNDRNLAQQPRPAMAATGASAAGSNAGAAGSFTPPDNPTAAPTWTGANATPPTAAGAPPPRRAATDEDAGTSDQEVLDPTVEFSWPESSSKPPTSDSCRAGTYVGTFSCVFTDSASGLFVVELMGDVSLTFVKSMSGEFLEISDGDFAALANLLIGARAKIRGKLDCKTLTLEAMAQEGAWAIGDPTLPLFPGGELQGRITGMLDPSTGRLSGQWTFGDPAIGSCPGTWSVTYERR